MLSARRGQCKIRFQLQQHWGTGVTPHASQWDFTGYTAAGRGTENKKKAKVREEKSEKWMPIHTSVVTVSKILPSVGFGRFCKKNRGFRFGFCLSRFPPVVNVVHLCGPLHIKPAAVRYIFLCITPVDSSKYPTPCDWWRENHHLYPTSHVLRNTTCLAVCAIDIRC